MRVRTECQPTVMMVWTTMQTKADLHRWMVLSIGKQMVVERAGDSVRRRAVSRCLRLWQCAMAVPVGDHHRASRALKRRETTLRVERDLDLVHHDSHLLSDKPTVVDVSPDAAPVNHRAQAALTFLSFPRHINSHHKDGGRSCSFSPPISPTGLAQLAESSPSVKAKLVIHPHASQPIAHTA